MRDLGLRRFLWHDRGQDAIEACWTGQGSFAKAQGAFNSARLRRWMRSRFDGRIAQLVEQLTLNQRVHGSSPCAPTIKIKYLAGNLSIQGEPEASSGQRLAQHQQNLVVQTQKRPGATSALGPFREPSDLELGNRQSS